MPDWLKESVAEGPWLSPWTVLIRLALALVAGGLVVFVYRKARSPVEQTPSFPPTLLLMTVLIAMATQVIGGNVARAFSLVGALSIVRFRTVVRDTLDTAFVIFAVIEGMAVGAAQPVVAVMGVIIVGGAAIAMRSAPARRAASLPTLSLTVRMGLGDQTAKAVEPILDEYLVERRLLSMSTAKQGVALDATYEVRLRDGRPVGGLVKALNLAEGVQSVDVATRDRRDDA
ncbi:MAG TPA: hypothetical protein VFV78_06075 [Vicinamibacterales bacterium]|nr:hypothetical protein [Vicinamibacterales bacterium]